jgi:predicted Zn-dependent protease
VAESPEGLDAWRALGHWLFERGTPAEAEYALVDLVRRIPADAAAHHNLGTLRLRMKRPAEAIRSLRQSVRLRPDAPATFLPLGSALKESGALEAAVGAWERLLRPAPGDPSAAAELERARGARRGARSTREFPDPPQLDPEAPPPTPAQVGVSARDTDKMIVSIGT